MERTYLPDRSAAKGLFGLRAKLILVTGALLITAIGTVSIVLFVGAERILRARVLSDLSALANARERVIEQRVQQDCERGLLIGSRRYSREYLVRRAANDPEAEQYRIDAVKSLAGAKKTSPSIRTIDVIDLKGSVVVSTSPGRTGSDVSGIPFFLKGKGGCSLSDIYSDEGLLAYDIWVPLFHPEKEEGEVVGVMRASIDLSGLLETLKDYLGLGVTGEVLLAQRAGDAVVFVTSLRHRPDAPLSVAIPLSSKMAEPMRLAVEGKEGIVIARDYRGVRVLAAHRYIPSGDWGLVTKIDAEEAFRPVRMLRLSTIFVAVMILLFSVLVVVLFSGRITGPIRDLGRATEKLAAGDLGYRVEVESRDEIGRLGTSFNTMAENLERITASRDELNREVVRRTEAEAKMREAAEYIALVFSLTPSAIFTVDTGRRVTAWNKRAEEITGYAAGEVLGRECLVFAGRPCNEGCGLFADGGHLPVISRECAIRRKDGQAVIVSKNCDLLRNRNGEVIGGIESFEDITVRKKAGEALMESEERYRTLVSNLPAVVYRCANDPAWTMEVISGEIQTVSGYPASDFIKNRVRSYASIIHQDDRAMVDRVIQKAVSGERPYVLEYRIVRADGAVRWVYEKGQATFAVTGGLLWLDGIIIDITERRKTEEELQRSREALTVDKFRMESMVESMVEGVVMLDEKDDVTVCNPQARWMLGFGSSETLTARGVSDKLKGLGLQEVLAECRTDKVLTAREVVGPQGHILRCEMMPVKTGSGAVMGTVVVLRDVTKEKEVERMKTEFVSTVSHELRTPLAITKEGISLVLDNIPGAINDQQRKILATAKGNIDRLSRIINDLLDISKIEAGRMEVKREKVVMQDLVASQLAAFARKARDKGIDLRADLPREPVSVYADADRLAQVLTNLVGNALKFTEGGSVEISVRGLDGTVECAVTDTGRGISKEDLPNIFDKFRQFGRSPGAGEKGTGLGLSIAKGIVEAHHGTIRVESEEGKGTKVIVTLPAYTPDTIIREYVAQAILTAREEETVLSLLVISFSDFERLKKDFTGERLDAVIQKVERLIQQGLRRAADLVLKDVGQIIVILDGCGRETAQRIEGRLSETLKKYLTGEGLSDAVRMRFGLAAYPDDATTEAALIEKAKSAETV